MKILQINKYLWAKGGADRYVLELSDLLTARGHEVIPFAMQDERNRPSVYSKYFVSPVDTEHVQLNRTGAKTFSRGFLSREAAQKMRALIRATHPDVAHVHNIYAQISPSVLDVLHQEKIPIVMTVHDYHLIMPNYMYWANGKMQDFSHRSLAWLTMTKFHKDSYAASFAQALAFKFHRWRHSYDYAVKQFIFPSQFVRDEYVRHGLSKDRSVIVPLFTDLLKYPPQYQDKGYILYFGRLVEEKGVHVLLKAMEGMPGVPCKIVGTGPEEAYLHIQGDRMPNVTFEGYQSGQTLWDLVAGARAVIVPSLFPETFGLVAIEAMALGKPVVASQIGALPELVVDRHTGFLIPPRDVHALREAIMRLAEDPVLATQFGRAGRARAERDYGVEKHYKNILGVYEKATGR